MFVTNTPTQTAGESEPTSRGDLMEFQFQIPWLVDNVMLGQYFVQDSLLVIIMGSMALHVCIWNALSIIN